MPPCLSLIRSKLLVGILMVLALLSLADVKSWAGTFLIGAADGSFETGLSGMVTQGDVRLVEAFGALRPTQGTQAVLLTTIPDGGAILTDADVSLLRIASVTVPPGTEQLRLDYNFLTNELTPSLTNDHFAIELVLVTVDGEETLLQVDTFTILYPAPLTGYASQTGFRTLIADLGTYADSGDEARLELRLADVGDGRVDSAVILDNMQWTSTDAPQAVANIEYIVVEPGDVTYFDGSGSMQAQSDIVAYRWEFGDGTVGIGRFVEHAYTQEGIYQATLTLIDQAGNTHTDTFLIVVGAVKHAPHIVSIPIVTAADHTPYRYDVVAEDEDHDLGDVLTFTLTEAPIGMHIDATTGVIMWTPTTESPRHHLVTVQVEDSTGLHDTQSYTLIVGPEVYIIATDGSGRLYQARSNGDGTFSAAQFVEEIGRYTQGVAIADFDADGDFDFVSGHAQSPHLLLYYYEKQGTQFAPPVLLGTVGSSSTPAGSFLNDMAAADFNNDGHMDFVVNGDTSHSWLLQHQGQLTFNHTAFFQTDFETDAGTWGGTQCNTDVARDDTTAYRGAWSMRVFASADASCLSTNISPAAWQLFQGPTLTFAYRVPPGVPVGLFVHVDGQGRLFLGGSPAAQPDASPAVPAVQLLDDDRWHVVTIDLYHSIRQQWPEAKTIGQLEWWTDSNAPAGAHFWFDEFQVTRRTMTDGFAASLLPNTGGNGRGMDAADINDDGHIDFARARCCDGHISLYRGDGIGNFTTTFIDDAQVDPYGVALADFDNDGVVDLIANQGRTGDPFFFRGNGDGTFQSGSYIGSLDPNDWSAYGAYDFNYDGNQDLVVVTWNRRQISYYPGNGDATFGTPRLIGTTSSVSLGIAAPAGRTMGQPFSIVTVDRDTVLIGETVTFDASGSYDDGTIVSYAWDFGDGTTASSPIVTHPFMAEGFYNVVVTIIDDEGKQDRRFLQVMVTGTSPVAHAGGPYTAGEADALDGQWTVVLDGSASMDAESDIARYAWDFDASDGVGVDATGVTPRSVYTVPGFYTVTLTVTDPAGQTHTATTTVEVQIGEPPVAHIAAPSVADETVAHVGQWSVGFDGSGSSDDVEVVAYVWDFGDGTSGTGVSPTHIYTNPNTYTVTLTVIDRAGQQGATAFTIIVKTNDPPVANAGGPYNLARDNSVQFIGSASTDDVSIAKYLWTFGDGMSSTDMNPVHVYATAETYTVTLIVTDNGLQMDTTTTTVYASQISFVDASGVTVDERTLEVDGTVSAQITNSYPTAIEAFTVIFFADRNGNGRYDAEVDTVLGRATQNGLPAGESMLVSASVSGMIPFRDAPIYAFLDTGDALAASAATNYANNGQACTFLPPVGAFDPVLEWEWTGSDILPASDQVMMTPAVIDLTADGVPDIVFATFTEGLHYLNGHLRAINGHDGSAIFTVTDPLYDVSGDGSIAVGDIDLDGRVEILAVSEGGSTLIAFEHDGAFKWRSPSIEGGIGAGGAAIADVDRDGTPEIVVGAAVLNNDGTVRWAGTQGRGNHPGNYAGPLSLVANLDLIDDAEIVAGNTAYRSDGSIYWHNSTVADGFNSVANFDSDPFPEIVLVAQGHVYLLEHDGSVKWGPSPLPTSGLGGPPTVADVDGDGEPEIGVAGAAAYAVFETDGTLKWSSPTQDASSYVTGSSVFDFEGDGSAEIIYGDELMLRIYRGSDGTVLWETPSPSGTVYELPIIVDVDADGNAEIVMVSNNYYIDGRTGIQVYGDANDTWVPTRQIWNQHTYHATNVFDDGTIPQEESPSWLGHNTYRLNLEITGQRFAAPDLTASFARIAVGDITADITARVGNGGALAVPAGIPVSFYDGDPHADGMLLGTVVTSQALAPGVFEDVTLTVSGETQHTVWVVADDDGSLTGTVSECREDNNLHHSGVQVQANQAPTAFAGGPYFVDEGTTITLDSTGSIDPNRDVLTYAWDLDGDGVFDDATSSTPLVAFPDAGTYTVTLRVSDGVVVSTDTAVITVTNVSPTVAAGSGQTVLAGTTVAFAGAFTDPGADTHTIRWDFGDETTASATLTPNHVYDAPGVYTVTLLVSDDDNGVGSDTLIVTVEAANRPPTAEAGTDQVVRELCIVGAGAPVALVGSGSDPDNDALTFTWREGDTLIATGATPTVRLAVGVHTLELTVTDAGGLMDTDTVVITVHKIGNLNLDTSVDMADLLPVISAYGPADGPGALADINCDGIVYREDTVIVLSQYGQLSP